MCPVPPGGNRLTEVDALTQEPVASVHGQSQMPTSLPHASVLPCSAPCTTSSSLKDTCPHVHSFQVVSREGKGRTPMAGGHWERLCASKGVPLSHKRQCQACPLESPTEHSIPSEGAPLGHPHDGRNARWPTGHSDTATEQSLMYVVRHSQHLTGKNLGLQTREILCGKICVLKSLS